ncbi:unnamed protein product [Candidula unifasciata]|uniref:Uncharacterized protein n=1 Tax=Candidula unifasciata TaxID=100452 RepID=A0A8S3ZPH7_9EUPU|nr:unnamed protein product [Candidula unifasciata]
MAQWRKETLRVLVDMDMVLCDFEHHLLAEFRSKYPNLPYIPLSKRRGFYAKDQYDKTFGSNSGDKIMKIYRDAGFFTNLPEIPNAVKAVKEMNDMNLVDVYICSSPMFSCNTCLTEKANWIENYLGHRWVEKLILIKDKTLINADVLIDDRPEITGANKAPHWEHVVFTACHNSFSEIGQKRRLSGWTDGSWRELISTFLKQLQINNVES